MKNPFTFLTKLFGKSIALILLPIVSVFSWAFSIVVFLYRLAAVAIGVIGFSLNAVDCYQHGFTAERGLIFLFILGVVALRFLLPLFVPVLQQCHDKLAAYICEPMTTKSPVRYTI